MLAAAIINIINEICKLCIQDPLRKIFLFKYRDRTQNLEKVQKEEQWLIFPKEQQHLETSDYTE